MSTGGGGVSGLFAVESLLLSLRSVSWGDTWMVGEHSVNSVWERTVDEEVSFERECQETSVY